MPFENEFKINEYITLKLERRQTNIYVKGELFQQCKFLLLNIPTEEIRDFDEIDSIDAAVEMLGWTEEVQFNAEYTIPPETEFWGHCSNLQVWHEYNYDTRLIHSNLAFPLLKRLVEEGDVNAKKIFKEEIVNRYIEGNETVQTYLMEQGYLNRLNKEELKILVLELFEKENYTGLTSLNLNRVPHIWFSNREVIDLLFDSDYEFKNSINDFLEEKRHAGVVIHKILLFLLAARRKETDEFSKDLYKKSLEKCFFQADNRGKLIIAHDAFLRIFDDKEREWFLNFIDFEVVNMYQPKDALFLLTHFIYYGSDKARIFLQEKIKKYFEDNNEVMIRLVVESEYIKYLDSHELDSLLENFDPTIITEQKLTSPFYDESYRQLEILARYGYSKAYQILKEEFLKIFEEDQIIGLEFLDLFLRRLKKNEIKDLLNNLDYNTILNQDSIHTFNTLSQLSGYGVPKARRIYKQLYGSPSLVKLFSSMDKNKEEIVYERELKLIRSILPPLEYAFLLELQALIDEKIHVFLYPGNSSSPSIVIEQKRISQIRMERQNIKELPKSLGNLNSLKVLNLNFNRLKNLPEEIGEIASLEAILLIENSITELPKTVGKLTHLRHLDLTRNKLDSLPPSFGKLKRLKYLNLNYNDFQNMPKSIGKLESLKYLFYDYNQIKNLPSVFHKLRNLERIDLQGNKLKTIPVALLDLGSIKKISLSKEYLDRETINLLEPIKKVHSQFQLLKKSNRDHSIGGWISKKSLVEPLNILFDKYILRFFYEFGGLEPNIFWTANDEARIKYDSYVRLYNLPLSSEIIDRFKSLYEKWYSFHEHHRLKEVKNEDEYNEFKNETRDTFLKAIKQLGPNFHVKFQMEGYGLPYER